ncbi:exported hypothetical protein [Xanthomonas citri pv. citri]|uniref:Lipoprotein n=1 Tax=Xanthomonas citri pv. citri TaxID=611301 RepID=A0A0U5BZF1_XANCI|nr:exported hypothetical protein [Xanthomonas citri pv. citri]CEE41773.1 exported hypothetical protein [Xanthomonas citri pv. citri]CEE41895.1 exported hypothetical protein [Xanthomonas citri pv. citri]CEE43741.1 exported hypothetical protein [Xanthomonas citri pv. citri]CEE48770.1 exported hypothetical protein [Xanthomonas citri pv. citri]
MMKLRYPLTLALLLGACASAVAGPIAAGKQRVLGSAYSPRQAQASPTTGTPTFPKMRANGAASKPCADR